MHNAILGAAALFLAAAAAPAAAQNREAEAAQAFTVYPEESAWNDEQGTVHYKVKIGRRGDVEECEVTQSSGFERLDRATCQLLMDKARFTPANGKRRSTFEGRVHWRLS